MKQASEIEKALRMETHAEDASYEKLPGPAYGEKQYRYKLLFVGSIAKSTIEKKMNLVEDKEDLPLKFVGIEPRLVQTDTSLDAGFVITIRETVDRAELENHNLGNFTDP